MSKHITCSLVINAHIQSFPAYRLQVIRNLKNFCQSDGIEHYAWLQWPIKIYILEMPILIFNTTAQRH